MRLRVARDGSPVEVEVAPDLSTVTVDGKTYTVSVVRATALRVELEVGGERVVVEGWPEHFSDPPAPVDVNGERGTVAIERIGGGPAPVPVAAVLAERPAAPLPTAASPPPVGGVAVVPPMPGKVIELRVADGERVAAGQVLLVLEAMKMRNEISSPSEGVIRGLRVKAGSNVRAKEPMLFVAPG